MPKSVLKGKELYQIIYSSALIVVIPAAIIVNTVIFTRAMTSRIDQILYDKTLAIAGVINAQIADDLIDSTALNSAIQQIKQFYPDIKALDILWKNDDNFKVVASLNKDNTGKLVTSLEPVIAWQQGQPVARLVRTGSGERQWLIITPLKNTTGQKQALLTLQVSLREMDSLTSQILWRSYIVLSLTILIIVLLLANQTRFFEYAKLYRRLKEVDQMKDEFISIASHELRTPVAAIRGYVSMILEGDYGKINREMKEGLEITALEADRLDKLVDDLLNVSRIEQGRLKIEAQAQDVSAVIEAVIKELKVKADEKNLQLSFKPHIQPLPMINIDSERFQQVMINLLANAIKYTMAGSVEVLTEMKADHKMLEIKIKDTGIGMTAEERQRLFEKFYRVKNDYTATITGTGLGLWITKQLVEMMKGKIMVDSIKDVGTQVTLGFPVVG